MTKLLLLAMLTMVGSIYAQVKNCDTLNEYYSPHRELIIDNKKIISSTQLAKELYPEMNKYITDVDTLYNVPLLYNNKRRLVYGNKNQSILLSLDIDINNGNIEKIQLGDSFLVDLQLFEKYNNPNIEYTFGGIKPPELYFQSPNYIYLYLHGEINPFESMENQVRRNGWMGKLVFKIDGTYLGSIFIDGKYLMYFNYLECPFFTGF